MERILIKSLVFLALGLFSLSAAAPDANRAATSANPSASVTPSPPGEQPVELNLAARSAIVLDSGSSQVLYQKNPDALEYPASATKILTALLVIESGDLDRLVTVELEDTKVEPSALGIKPGEQFPRKHLLYVLLLKSANDVAMALARDNAGSVEAFAEKMNKRAAELGASHSRFVNPHGLHDPKHYVTARDLAIIALAAMKNPLFREIVSTHDMRILKDDEWLLIKNHNRLLDKLPGCIGVKTGFTRPAQQVLVSAASRDGREVLAVVLHTNKPGIWDDSQLLLLHGLEKLGVAIAPSTFPPQNQSGPPRESPKSATAGSGKDNGINQISPK